LIFLDAAGDDPERAVRKRVLQLQGLVWRRGHPGLDFVRRRQEGVEVVVGLAFLDLPDRCPVGPDAGEAGEGAALIEGEPDVAAFGLV
jgi:hypothetical protein